MRPLTVNQVSNQLYSSLQAQNDAALSFVGDLELRVGGAADHAVAILVRSNLGASSNLTSADDGALQASAHSSASELSETVTSLVRVRLSAYTNETFIYSFFQELAVAGVSAADLTHSLQSGTAAAAKIVVSDVRMGRAISRRSRCLQDMQTTQLQSLETTTLLQAQQKNASRAALELADDTLEAIHRLRSAAGVNNVFQLSSIRVLPLIYRMGEHFEKTLRKNLSR